MKYDGEWGTVESWFVMTRLDSQDVNVGGAKPTARVWQEVRHGEAVSFRQGGPIGEWWCIYWQMAAINTRWWWWTRGKTWRRPTAAMFVQEILLKSDVGLELALTTSTIVKGWHSILEQKRPVKYWKVWAHTHIHTPLTQALVWAYLLPFHDTFFFSFLFPLLLCKVSVCGACCVTLSCGLYTVLSSSWGLERGDKFRKCD